MRPHIKNYLKHFEVFGDFVACEVCWRAGTEFHHIKYKSQWGKDNVENIACLCRECHQRCHFIWTPYIKFEEIETIHNKKLYLFKIRQW